MIYFVQRRDGLIKIGTTTNLETRLATLAKSHGPLSILRTIEGERRREREIQVDLTAFHEFGEWFRPELDLLEYIKVVPGGEALKLVADKLKAEWDRGEKALVSEAVRLADRLIAVRRQRTGLRKAKAIAALKESYGFTGWFFDILENHTPETVTAYALQTLRSSLQSELELMIEELKAILDAEPEIATRKAALKSRRADE